MALLFTVVGKTNDPELLEEERYYRICNAIGLSPFIADKKKADWVGYYTKREYLKHIPVKFIPLFGLMLKEAA
jgi:hypothetical protein